MHALVSREHGDVVEQSAHAEIVGDAYVDSLEVEGVDAIWALIDIIVDADLVRYDSAVRAWAHHDKRAGTVLRRADKRRIEFITELFAKAGFLPEEAAARGRMLPVYLMGERTTGFAEPAAVRSRRMKRRFRLLLANGRGPA